MAPGLAVVLAIVALPGLLAPAPAAGSGGAETRSRQNGGGLARSAEPRSERAVEPAELVEVGALGGRIRAAAVAGDYRTVGEAVLLGHDRELLVLDILAEGRTAPRSAMTLPGKIRDIATLGALGAVALDDAGVALLDIGNPDAPSLLAHLDLPGTARAVAFPDDAGGSAGGDGAGAPAWLAVAAGEAGLQVVDVSDPARPRLVGSAGTPREAADVATRGGRAYVIETGLLDALLRVIEVEAPGGPRELALVDLGAGAAAVALLPPEGEPEPGPPVVRALVAGYAGALWSLDLTDPGAPVRIGHLPGDPTLGLLDDDRDGTSLALAANGGTALLGMADAGVRIVDVTDLGRPFAARDRRMSGPVVALTAGYGGWRTILALDTGGAVILDSRARNRLPETWRWDLIGRAVDLVGDGDHAFVGDQHGTARAIDTSDPSAMRAVGVHTVEDGRPEALAALGGYLFIATAAHGIDTAWMSDPTNPVAGTNWEQEAGFKALAAEGTWLFGVQHSGGVAPRSGWTVGATAPVSDSKAISDGALLQLAGSALRAFDVSRPLRPGGRSAMELPANPTGLAVAGAIAYVTVRGAGLATVDVSDPLEPVGIGGVRTPGEALDVDLGDGLAFVADGDWGVTIADVSDPSLPTVLATLDTPGRARRVTAHGEWLWVADEAGGVLLVDVSDPRAPSVAARGDVPGAAIAVAFRPPYAFTADSTGWLIAHRLDGVAIAEPSPPAPTVGLPSPEPSDTPSPTPTGSPTPLVSATPTSATWRPPFDPPGLVYVPRAVR